MFVKINNIMREFLTYQNLKKNKYYLLYTKIITNANKRGNIKGDYGIEVHHILPKSLGGSNSKNNLVCLTFREHYLCHMLLTKFTKNIDKAKMCCALHVFFHFTKYRNIIHTPNSRQYEYHKRRYIDSFKYRTPHIKSDCFTFKNQKNGNVFIGNRQEFKKYSSLSNQYISALINQYQKSVKGWGVFLVQKQMFSFDEKRKSVIFSPIICEYCNKSISPMNHAKWHGINCKSHDPKKFAKQAEQITNLQKIRHFKKNI
jgi:hypothetical protein